MVRVIGRHLIFAAAAAVSVAATGIGASAADSNRDWRRDWATLHNERHGFLIAYPVEIFAQKSDPTTDEGRVLYSSDGHAQLLVGAFANEDASSLSAYRDFVVSGTIGDREFYERVTFTCGGRLINSWAMVYPHAENRFYDRVVEAVARTYSPGAGRSGNCD